MSTSALVAELVDAFEGARDPARAEPMRRYMRDQFEFLGIPTPVRRALQRPIFATSSALTQDGLLDTARTLWCRDEREYQYAACDLLIRFVRRLDATAMPTVEELITSKSWWDTVDALASRVAGPLVLRDRSLDALMDRWIISDDLWLARTAILHQLRWKEATDEARLFGMCLCRAADGDFFIRKAIGWALREYAKTSPDAVRTFVHEHADALSQLSRDEAMKHVG